MLECKHLRQLKHPVSQGNNNYINFLSNSPRITATPQNVDHHLCVLKIFTEVNINNLKALHLQFNTYKTGGLRHSLTCCLAEIHSFPRQV